MGSSLSTHTKLNCEDGAVVAAWTNTDHRSFSIVSSATYTLLPVDKILKNPPPSRFPSSGLSSSNGSSSGSILNGAQSRSKRRVVWSAPEGSRITAALHVRELDLAILACDGGLSQFQATTGQPLGPLTNSGSHRNTPGPSSGYTGRSGGGQSVDSRHSSSSRAHSGPISSLVFLPPEDVVSVAADGVNMWNVVSGGFVQSFAASRQRDFVPVAAAYDPTTTHLIVGYSNGWIHVLDSVAGTKVTEVRGHDGRIGSMAVAPGPRILITSASDTTFRLWDLDCLPAAPRELCGYRVRASAMFYDIDRNVLFTGNQDGAVVVYRLERSAGGPQPASAQILRHDDGKATVTFVGYSSDLDVLYTGDVSGQLKLWEAETGLSASQLDPISQDHHQRHHQSRPRSRPVSAFSTLNNSSHRSSPIPGPDRGRLPASNGASNNNHGALSSPMHAPELRGASITTPSTQPSRRDPAGNGGSTAGRSSGFATPAPELTMTSSSAMDPATIGQAVDVFLSQQSWRHNRSASLFVRPTLDAVSHEKRLAALLPEVGVDDPQARSVLQGIHREELELEDELDRIEKKLERAQRDLVTDSRAMLMPDVGKSELEASFRQRQEAMKARHEREWADLLARCEFEANEWQSAQPSKRRQALEKLQAVETDAENAGRQAVSRTAAAMREAVIGCFPPGSLIAGRYQIGLPVSKDASSVYRGLDVVRGRSVAIKAFPPGLPLNPTLAHENVCPVLDCLETDVNQFVVSPLMPFTLSTWLTSSNASGLSESTVAAIMYQLLNGVTYLHSRSMVHRDIRPANVVLSQPSPGDEEYYAAAQAEIASRAYSTGSTAGGGGASPATLNARSHPHWQWRVQLVHFGVMRALTGEEPPEAGAVFAAPEVYGLSVSGASDLWSVGCIMARLLSQLSPVGSETTQQAPRAPPPLFAGSEPQSVLKSMVEVVGQPGEAALGAMMEDARVGGNQDTQAAMQALVTFVRSLPSSTASQSRAISSSLFPDASNAALDLLKQLLVFHPRKRLGARDALEHPWFNILQQQTNISRATNNSNNSLRGVLRHPRLSGLSMASRSSSLEARNGDPAIMALRHTIRDILPVNPSASAVRNASLGGIHGITLPTVPPMNNANGARAANGNGSNNASMDRFATPVSITAVGPSLHSTRRSMASSSSVSALMEGTRRVVPASSASTGNLAPPISLSNDLSSTHTARSRGSNSSRSSGSRFQNMNLPPDLSTLALSELRAQLSRGGGSAVLAPMDGVSPRTSTSQQPNSARSGTPSRTAVSARPTESSNPMAQDIAAAAANRVSGGMSPPPSYAASENGQQQSRRGSGDLASAQSEASPSQETTEEQ